MNSKMIADGILRAVAVIAVVLLICYFFFKISTLLIYITLAVIISLIGLIGFLTAGVLFAGFYGMSNTWQFLLGINLLILAALFKTYQSGIKQKKSKNQPNNISKNQFSLVDDTTYLR